MSIFKPLEEELRLHRAAGLPLPLWWRDDDAVAPSAALDRLLAQGERVGIPLHLAVIPRDATEALADRLQGAAEVAVLVHGWAHQSHAPEGQKKAEFNHPRADAKAEAAAGLQRIAQMFGPRHLPMFVPPWNRISPEFSALLPDLGYRALSTFTPRKAPFAAPGLAQINTHIDPIHWRGGGGLRAPEAVIAALVQTLAERRKGVADGAEPLGLLTHHLVHDAAIDGFVEACLTCLLDGGALPLNLLISKDYLHEQT